MIMFKHLLSVMKDNNKPTPRMAQVHRGASRPASQAWFFFFPAQMKACKFFPTWIKQGINLITLLKMASLFYLTKSYSDREIKVSEHATKSLSLLENTQTKHLDTRNWLKSMCMVPDCQYSWIQPSKTENQAKQTHLNMSQKQNENGLGTLPGLKTIGRDL